MFTRRETAVADCTTTNATTDAHRTAARLDALDPTDLYTLRANG
jgi:hypothetical protein